MVSKGQIRLIHLAKDRLGLTEEEYKEALAVYAGARSSKELTPKGFFSLMEYFRELGFTPRGAEIPGIQKEAAEKSGEFIEMVTPAQSAKIRELTVELGWADNPARLKNFMAKRFGIVKVLTKEQAIKVIEALKAMAGREKPTGSNAGTGP
jgi:phage gp16-like protein